MLRAPSDRDGNGGRLATNPWFPQALVALITARPVSRWGVKWAVLGLALLSEALGALWVSLQSPQSLVSSKKTEGLLIVSHA